MTKSRRKSTFSCKKLAILVITSLLLIFITVVVYWATRPMTLEEMTAIMPDNPSTEWMEQYVECAYQSEEFWECIVPWNGNPDLDDWWEWIFSLPLQDEDGSGQFFYIKWMWAVPHQYPGYQGLSHEEYKQIRQELPTEDYMQYFVTEYRNDPLVKKRVSYLEEDPEGWWNYFNSLPLYDAKYTNQYGLASTDVLTPPDAIHSGWHGVHTD